MLSPAAPKIYHIVHMDRLASIIAEDTLCWCDAELQEKSRPGTTIGMAEIKQRRLTNPVKCHSGLKVGDCVPFYFCPRSVMLYLIYKVNPALDYRGGQGSILHLEADLRETIDWAERNQRRWAFTLSNAGSSYFEDRCDLTQLDEIDWDAVQARNWRGRKGVKQAEFLVERLFPWTLVQRLGVFDRETCDRATEAIQSAAHRPAVEVRQDWYY